LKGENLEIRRFLAVLVNSRTKIKNIIPLKYEHYCFRG
jgi:hypothetical protein